MKLRINQQNEAQEFYGHGKLLLTGEYFVLDGAKALALPTKLGQRLRVKELNSQEGILYWVALHQQKQVWLNLVFDTADFSCLNNRSEEAQRLTAMLRIARQLNPDFLNDKKDRAVETLLEFPNDWGLGSSSTLSHNLAAWADVSAHQLLQKSIGGSGYDVACAAHDLPLIYQLIKDEPAVQTVRWKPPFSEQLYFAFLGKKQRSTEGIKYYREHILNKSLYIEHLNHLTEGILKCTELEVFEDYIKEHEMIVGNALNLQPVKQKFFSDYWGCVKSLGAWGGDFVLLTNPRSREELSDYLLKNKINVLFRYDELILNIPS